MWHHLLSYHCFNKSTVDTVVQIRQIDFALSVLSQPTSMQIHRQQPHFYIYQFCAMTTAILSMWCDIWSGLVRCSSAYLWTLSREPFQKEMPPRSSSRASSSSLVRWFTSVPSAAASSRTVLTTAGRLQIARGKQSSYYWDRSVWGGWCC